MKVDKYSKRKVDFVTASFASGMRLAYVIELERFATENDVAIKSFFKRIGRLSNASRFSQWKKHGVPQTDKMLGAILKLDGIPIIDPTPEVLFHWGYRLAVVQTRHALIENQPNIKSCRQPLDLSEFVYLSVGHEIAISHGQNLNPRLVEHCEIVHSLLPETILQLVPDGSNLSWFTRLLADFHEAFVMVVDIIGTNPGTESGAEAK